MWKEALEQITSEMWKNSVRHTEHKSKECWHREQHLEDQVEALIFVANTGESLNEFDSEDNIFFYVDIHTYIYILFIYSL
jgi:hypothetical protein